LPCGSSGYLTNPEATRPCAPYEVFDPETGKPWEGVFVVGWARNASEGLVGIARHDGEVGASHVLDYLTAKPVGPAEPVEKIAEFLMRNQVRFVLKSDLPYLYTAEDNEMKARGLSWFKFSDDDQMLSIIEKGKADSQELVGSPGD
jgi:ferredoxin--NADP+ reductase